MTHEYHQPVLATEVCSHVPQNARIVVDGTAGDGGHAEALLAHSDRIAQYLALDRDPKAIERAKKRLEKFKNVHFFNQSFEFADDCAKSLGISSVDAILLDLGFSSPQIEDPMRGFSFQLDGPLDMRYDPKGILTAAGLLATLNAGELATIFRNYGDEKFSNPIAKEIVRVRKTYSITRTKQLADLVTTVYAQRLKSRSKIPWVGGAHPATKIFQALRIAVNDELGTVKRSLPKLGALLAPHGRLLVITFHSLEDTIVKHWMVRESRDCICPAKQAMCTCNHKATVKRITKKAIIAAEAEVKNNPRSRSAHLRIVEKI